MELTTWVAIAVFVYATGQVQVDRYPEPLATKAECEEIQAQAIEKLTNSEGLIAMGVKCTEVVVKSIEKPKKISVPPPPSLETKTL